MFVILQNHFPGKTELISELRTKIFLYYQRKQFIGNQAFLFAIHFSCNQHFIDIAIDLPCM